MDYKDVRKKFVELSGRYDLITNTDEDNGADFFLNAGQKYLDRMLDSGKMVARYPVLLTAGTVVAKTIGLRAIKEVWIADSAGQKSQLERKAIADLRACYDEESSDISRNTPLYYAPAIFRPYPDTLATVTGMKDVEDLLLYSVGAPAQHFNYNGIIVMPPPDATYTLSIWGLFYSPTLSATLAAGTWTQVKSFWTEVHPEILLSAGLFKLESFYRNTEGAKDFKQTVMDDMTGLDFDSVEEDLVGDLQMRG
jgi:hypothetical protein